MTSVNWLIRQISINDSKIIKKFGDLFEQAKQMEKQQIIDAANQNQFGDIDGMGICDAITRGEQYYDETFGSKGSDERIVDTNNTISSQTEISDEEIEQAALEYFADYKGGANQWEISAFIMGMKKYREQLKKKQ